RAILYLPLFGLMPLLLIYLKLSGGTQEGWFFLSFCSGVMMLPGLVVVLIGIVMRQRFVKVLDDEGATSGRAKKYLWKDLHYVDHASGYRRSSKIKDNQINLVFADGITTIPPLIHDRDKVWALINSMPAEVRFDGKVLTSQP
ncbi:MAG: hypothetical protein ABJB40_13145, partial [Acidobacteriota bacterium]